QGAGFDCTGKEAWIDAAKLAGQTLERDNFTGFVDSTAAVEQVARGVSAIAVTYSGDVDYRKADSPEIYGDLAFFAPEEGAQLGVDTFVVPARAPHPELAEDFISFMMRPENAAKAANYAYYRTPNEAALPMVDEALREVSQLDATASDHLVTTPLIEGEALTMLQQLWTEVRSR
ncbi:MAG: extracellular solute-binding protein, partial [Pseudomonadota bacterium]|nr:extracellular solute-binding protein [Pseudomonadota bacterium]